LLQLHHHCVGVFGAEVRFGCIRLYMSYTVHLLRVGALQPLPVLVLALGTNRHSRMRVSVCMYVHVLHACVCMCMCSLPTTYRCNTTSFWARCWRSVRTSTGSASAATSN